MGPTTDQIKEAVGEADISRVPIRGFKFEIPGLFSCWLNKSICILSLRINEFFEFPDYVISWVFDWLNYFLNLSHLLRRTEKDFSQFSPFGL